MDDLEILKSLSAGNASSEKLKAAAESRYSFIRKELALYPHCPVKYLKDLATDKRITVRWNVVRNRKTPKTVLRLMKDEKHMSILRDLLLHQNCPQEVYDYVKTRNIKHKWIEYALIKKGGYDIVELQEYLFSASPKIRKAAAVSIRRLAKKEVNNE